MNYEKYIDKAFGLFQALLLALMTLLFSGFGYAMLNFEKLDRIRLIIIGGGLLVLLIFFCVFAFFLAKILKELKGD